MQMWILLLITLLLFVSCKFHLALPHEMHVAYTVKEVASFWWAWSINGKRTLELLQCIDQQEENSLWKLQIIAEIQNTL